MKDTDAASCGHGNNEGRGRRPRWTQAATLSDALTSSVLGVLRYLRTQENSFSIEAACGAVGGGGKEERRGERIEIATRPRHQSVRHTAPSLPACVKAATNPRLGLAADTGDDVDIANPQLYWSCNPGRNRKEKCGVIKRARVGICARLCLVSGKHKRHLEDWRT